MVSLMVSLIQDNVLTVEQADAIIVWLYTDSDPWRRRTAAAWEILRSRACPLPDRSRTISPSVSAKLYRASKPLRAHCDGVGWSCASPARGKVSATSKPMRTESKRLVMIRLGDRGVKAIVNHLVRRVLYYKRIPPVPVDVFAEVCVAFLDALLCVLCFRLVRR